MLDYGTEVRHEHVSFDALAEENQSGGGVCVLSSKWGIVRRQKEQNEGWRTVVRAGHHISLELLPGITGTVN